MDYDRVATHNLDREREVFLNRNSIDDMCATMVDQNGTTTQDDRIEEPHSHEVDDTQEKSTDDHGDAPELLLLLNGDHDEMHNDDDDDNNNVMTVCKATRGTQQRMGSISERSSRTRRRRRPTSPHLLVPAMAITTLMSFVWTLSHLFSSSASSGSGGCDSAWADQLRLQIASWSIDMMLAEEEANVDSASMWSSTHNRNSKATNSYDDNDTNKFLVDIGPFADLIEVGLDTLGIQGVFGDGDNNVNGLFDPSKFASSLMVAAKAKGLTSKSQFQVRLGRGHEKTTTVLYGGSVPLMANGDDDDDVELTSIPKRCLNNAGCLIWLRHYSGAIAANKLVRDGWLRISSANGNQDGCKKEGSEGDDNAGTVSQHRIVDSAVGFMNELKTLQRNGIHDAATTDAEHGFIWTYASLVRKSNDEAYPTTMDTFPTQLAEELCGEYLEMDEVLEVSELNLGWVCRHGFGHAVYYSLAYEDIMKRRSHYRGSDNMSLSSKTYHDNDAIVDEDIHGAALLSGRKQIRPNSGFVLSEEYLCKGFQLCSEAPNYKVQLACENGMIHSYVALSFENHTIEDGRLGQERKKYKRKCSN